MKFNVFISKLKYINSIMKPKPIFLRREMEAFEDAMKNSGSMRTTTVPQATFAMPLLILGLALTRKRPRQDKIRGDYDYRRYRTRDQRAERESSRRCEERARSELIIGHEREVQYNGKESKEYAQHISRIVVGDKCDRESCNIQKISAFGKQLQKSQTYKRKQYVRVAPHDVPEVCKKPPRQRISNAEGDCDEIVLTGVDV